MRRHRWALAAWVAACLALTAAQRPTSPEETRAAAIAAHESGATDELAALARRARPWIVADRLHRTGRSDVARALARTTPDVVASPLLALLATPAPPEDAEAEEILEQVAAQVATPAAEAELGARVLELESDMSAVLRTRAALALGTRRIRVADFDGALEALDVAAATARSIEWIWGEAQALGLIGWAARQGPHDLARALEAWSRAVGLDERLGRPNPLRRFYLGNLLLETGRARQAREHLDRARREFQARSDPREVWALQSLGLAQQRLGQPSSALEAYERALELAPSGSALDASSRRLLAEVLSRLGDADRAVELARESVRLYEGLGDSRGIAWAHGTLGLCFERRGDDRQALDALEVARGFYDAKGGEPLVITLTNLALVRMKLDELERAETLARRAQELARELSNDWLQAGTSFHLGQILTRRGEYEEARVYDDQVLRIGHEMASSRLLMRGHLNAARRSLAQGHDAAAVQAARKAIAQVQQTVTGLELEEDARARDHRVELYEVGLRAALATERPAAVLEMVESSRARALIEAVGGREQVEETVLDEAAVREHRAAEEQEVEALRVLREVLADDPTDAATTERDAYTAARARTREIEEGIRRVAGSAAELAFPEVARLDTVQRSLSDSEALVLFAQLAQELYALVVRRTNARIVALGDAAALTDGARTLHIETSLARGTAFGEPPREDIVSLAATLRERLAAPLELAPSVRRVLVSPDGPLAYVPFALVFPEHEIVHVPSATTYHLLAQRDDPEGERVLALGDPAYDPTDTLPRLPGSGREAEALGAPSLVGEDATLAALKEQLEQGRWRSVHLACHALVDPDRPLESVLALAPSANDDGRVSVREVFGWNVDADLVVLSACQTGIGRVYRTEGVFGFTRAFLCAGAPRVLVSLWRVDDEATRALMVKLYELWNPEDGDGTPLATALKQAQEHVRAQPGWAAPHYWAGWQLWGLGD